MRRVAVLAVLLLPTTLRRASAEPESGVDELRRSDAAVDRAYLSPTGFTTPRGATTVQLWAPLAPLVAGTVSYGPTDWLELSAGGAIADGGPDLAGGGYAAVKAALLRGPRVGIAAEVQVAVGLMQPVPLTSLAASACVDARCRTVLSAYVGAAPLRALAADEPDMIDVHVVGGGSLVTGGRLRLVVDTVVYDEADLGDDRWYEAAYVGARLVRARWSLDAGMVAYARGVDSLHVLPLPLVGFAARL